jgi:hypothetical protein
MTSTCAAMPGPTGELFQTLSMIAKNTIKATRSKTRIDSFMTAPLRLE